MAEETKILSQEDFIALLDYDTDDTNREFLIGSHAALLATLSALREERRWIPVEEWGYDIGDSKIMGFNPAWIDLDFNPSGVRECEYPDGERWVSAKWCDEHEHFVSADSKPTHILNLLPTPPTDTAS